MTESIFVYNLSRRFSQNIQLLQNHKDNYGASCKPKNDAPMEQIFLPTPKSPTFKDISGFFLKKALTLFYPEETKNLHEIYGFD